MKQKYWTLFSFITIYVIVIALILKFSANGSTAETWVTITTGFILIWYTWETMILRQIASKQLDLQLQPLVIYKNDEKEEIENIGNSVALNIKIEPVRKKNGDFMREIIFPEFTAPLKPNHKTEIKTKTYLNGEEINLEHSAYLNVKHATDQSILIINFENQIGEKFYVKQLVAPKNTTILEAKRI